jgi:hypothetical protein
LRAGLQTARPLFARRTIASLALLLADRVGIDVTAASSPPSAEAKAVRDEIRAKLDAPR